MGEPSTRQWNGAAIHESENEGGNDESTLLTHVEVGSLQVLNQRTSQTLCSTTWTGFETYAILGSVDHGSQLTFLSAIR